MKINRITLALMAIAWFGLFEASTYADSPQASSPSLEASEFTAPPKDRLSIEWVQFIHAHPPGTSRAHPVLHAGVTTQEVLDKTIKELRMDLDLCFNGTEFNWYHEDTDYMALASIKKILQYSVTAEDYVTYAKLQQAYYDSIETLLYLEKLHSDRDWDQIDIEPHIRKRLWDLPVDDQTLEEMKLAEIKASILKERPQWLREALRALNVAIELKHPNLGAVLARRGAIHAMLGEHDAAFESLEQAVAAGFHGFLWMHHTPRLEALRAYPKWVRWYQKMLPPHMVDVPLKDDFYGIFRTYGDRNIKGGKRNAKYIFCADGRYLEDIIIRDPHFYAEGYWKLSDKGLTLYPQGACRDKLPCPPISKVDLKKLSRAHLHLTRTLLLHRQEVVIIQQNPDIYEDESSFFNPIIPEYCR